MRTLALPLLAADYAADPAEDGKLPGLEGSFIDELIFVAIVLVAICLFFYMLIRWLLPRMSRAAGGRGLRVGGGRIIRVVDRCVLEPRRALYVVEVAGMLNEVRRLGADPAALLAAGF